MSTLSNDLRKLASTQTNSQDQLTLLLAAKKLEQLEQDAIYRSWQGAVDRQSGAFTQDEIDARESW